MKKREVGKRIIALVYAILLCVCVSFAWILTEKENIVKDVTIGYNDGRLVIAPPDIQGKIIITDEAGNESELTEDFKFDSTDVLPNSVIAFTLRIKNNAYNDNIIDISIVGISPEKAEILDVVYFSATPSSGWKTNTPPSTYTGLADAKLGADGTYSLTIAKAVVLRPTEVNNPDDCMEYECYFYFDGETMTNAHQDIDLGIGAIRLIQR